MSKFFFRNKCPQLKITSAWKRGQNSHRRNVEQWSSLWFNCSTPSPVQKGLIWLRRLNSKAGQETWGGANGGIMDIVGKRIDVHTVTQLGTVLITWRGGVPGGAAPLSGIGRSANSCQLRLDVTGRDLGISSQSGGPDIGRKKCSRRKGWRSTDWKRKGWKIRGSIKQ